MIKAMREQFKSTSEERVGLAREYDKLWERLR